MRHINILDAGLPLPDDFIYRPRAASAGLERCRVSRRTQIIAAVWFFQVANYLDRVVVSFAGPSIMKSMSMSPASFGAVLSSFGVGYFLAQIPGGAIADRWGAKPLMVIGPLFWALFTGLTGLVAGLTGFVAVRLCFGISEGLSNACCYKVIGDNFDSQQRARAVSIWATAFAIAPAFAGPAVGVLLGLYGWRLVFAMMMAPALAAALINYLLIPNSRPSRGDRRASGAGRSEFRAILRSPSLVLIAFAYLAFNIAYWGYLGWMPSYLALAHHIDVKSIGLLGGIPYLFAIAGLLLAGWLSSSILYRYRGQLLVVAYVLAALSLVLAYNAVSVTMSIVGLSSAAFFLYGGFGPFGAILLDLAPENIRAVYSGIVNAAGQVGGAVAPVIIGMLVKATGTFAFGFALMICGLLVAAACLLAAVATSARQISPEVPGNVAIALSPVAEGQGPRT